MPIIHDFKCTSCNWFANDEPYEINVCPICGNTAYKYFGNWQTIQVDPRHDERLDSKGNVRQFGALEDPLALANMGLGSGQLASYCKVSEEKQIEFRERLIKDGDSGKLRKDVLEAYNDATGKKFEVQRD